MKQEEWTNEVLNSLEGIQRVEPSPYLYSKIQTRLNSNMEEKIPFRWAFFSIASLVLLFVINILFVRHTTDDSSTDRIEKIIYEQQLINSDQLY